MDITIQTKFSLQNVPQVYIDRIHQTIGLYSSCHFAYLLTCLVTQNCDAVLTSRHKMASAVVELSTEYLVDN